MRVIAFKEFKLQDKAKHGRNLMEVVAKQLCLNMANDVTQILPPYITVHMEGAMNAQKEPVTRYQSQFNILTEAHERQIIEQLAWLRTKEPVSPERCRLIRETILSIMLQDWKKISFRVGHRTFEVARRTVDAPVKQPIKPIL